MDFMAPPSGGPGPDAGAPGQLPSSAPPGVEQVLTKGAIARLIEGDIQPSMNQPTVIVKECRALGANRWKMTLADTDHYGKVVVDFTASESEGLSCSNFLGQTLQRGCFPTFTLIKIVQSKLIQQAGGKRFPFLTDAEVVGPCPEEFRGAWQKAYNAAGPAPDDIQGTQPASATDLQQRYAAQPTPQQQPPRFGSAFETPPKKLMPPQGTTPQDVDARPGYGINPYGGAGPAVPAANCNAGPFDANPYSGAPAAPGGGVQAQPPGFNFPPPAAAPESSASRGNGNIRAFFDRGAQGGAPAGARGGASAAGCMPISTLTPYAAGRWKIKARVTMKGEIKKFNNSRGEGQLLKVDLRDASGEIQATFFGKAAGVNNARLRQNQVYYFSKGNVKAANKRFDRGEFVITFDDHTLIEDADEDSSIPGIKYDFTPLAEAVSKPEGSTADIAAVVCECRDPQSIMIKNGFAAGTEKLKRDLVLWDESGDPERGTHIELTVWGERANEEIPADTVVFLKGAVIKQWQGRPSFGTGQLFSLETSPDNPRAFLLGSRWNEKGKPGYTPTFSSGSGGGSLAPGSTSRQNIAECQQEDVRLAVAAPGAPLQGTVHRHTIIGTIVSVVAPDRPPYYTACPESVEYNRPDQQSQRPTTRTCNKKVTQDHEGGLWRCNAGHCCQRPNFRYLCRLQVADDTGSMEVSVFDELGVSLFGCTASEFAAIWDDESRHEEVKAKLQTPIWRRGAFKLRAQKEVYNEEERIKYVLNEAQAMPVVAEGKQLLSAISQCIGGL